MIAIVVTNTQTLQALLKASGYSATKQRALVFELLSGQEPLTMHELVEQAGDRLDRASVYRTIALFERLGVVQRLQIGWKYKLELSDKFATHHHHLVCTHCGRIIAINEHALEQFIEQTAHSHQFTATNHQIEIQGTCIHCAKLTPPTKDM